MTRFSCMRFLQHLPFFPAELNQTYPGLQTYTPTVRLHGLQMFLPCRKIQAEVRFVMQVQKSDRRSAPYLIVLCSPDDRFPLSVRQGSGHLMQILF